MSGSDPFRRYGPVAVLLHWLVALAVLVQFTWGWAMQQIPKSPPGLRADAFNLHKSIGLTILFVMLARLLWRIANPPPALPPMPDWQRRAALANHALLYALLVALPVVGYLGSVWSGYPVRWFGVTLPSWAARSDALKSTMSVAHLVLGWLLAAAVSLHVAAAIKHARERDGVLRRMLPAWMSGEEARSGRDWRVRRSV